MHKHTLRLFVEGRLLHLQGAPSAVPSGEMPSNLEALRLPVHEQTGAALNLLKMSIGPLFTIGLIAYGINTMMRGVLGKKR